MQNSTSRGVEFRYHFNIQSTVVAKKIGEQEK